MLYRLYRLVANNTLYGNILCHFDDALHSSTRQMNATQTNMEESEHDNSEQEEDSDDQPRQSELVPKRGATSIAWTWFGFEKSDTDQKNVLCKVCRKPVPSPDSNTTNLFYHLRMNHDKQYGESLRMKSTKVQSSSAQNFLVIFYIFIL